MKRFGVLLASAALAAIGHAAGMGGFGGGHIGGMANGQITIQQSHLPHHLLVSVPVDY